MPGPSTPSVATAQGVVSFNDGQAQFAVAENETILLAGLRAGLPLPYECASGGCGTCKAKLVGGRVRTRWANATGLSERDRRKGDRILMCQSLPEGECHVQVTLKGEGETPEAPSPARSSARLRERRLLTTDTALFVFV
ncbi:MAG TPA: 2Fe-2S iron-sulfur cluster-binding protein, partial [Nocardioidaceae bacterium]|nr:2Fe-2S iron-sulfur cluster-binding protein [Nocardioidaceae bacterium]